MTSEPIHSGKELYGNLDVLGMSAAELCRWIGVPGEPITEILSGRRPFPATRRCGQAAFSERQANSG